MYQNEEYAQQLEKIMASLREELCEEKRRIETLQERVAEGEKLIAAMKASVAEPAGRKEPLMSFFELTDDELTFFASAPKKAKSLPLKNLWRQKDMRQK